MSAAFALLLLAAGQSRPEVVPPDADAARRLVCDALLLSGDGLLHRQPNRLAEAIRCLEEAVRLDPGSVPPRQLLVHVYAALGRPTDAAGAAAAVVTIDPSRAETWLTLARLLHAMKRTGEAIAVLNRCVAAPAIRDQPADLIAAHRELARLYSAVNAHPQAADACRKALELTTTHRSALLARAAGPADLDRERARLSELLAKESLSAKRFADARDAALEARDGFRKANEPTPAADVTPALAAAYAGLGDAAKAHAVLDAHLRARPRDLAAFALKARLLREAGDTDAAVAFLRRAAEADREFLPLWVLLGDELRKAGDGQQAKNAYQVVLERKPDVAAYRGLFAVLSGPGGSPTAILNLIDEKARETRPERGNKDAPEDEAARQRRETAAAHTRAITAALRLEPAAAGLALTAAVAGARNPPARFAANDGLSEDTWMILADVAAEAGQINTAETMLRRALTAAGRSADVRIYIALVSVLQAKRDRKAVVEVCRQGLKAPQSSKLFFRWHLAKALAQLGDIKNALAEADKAVELAEAEKIAVTCATRVFVLRFAERFDEAEAECENLLAAAKTPGETLRIRHELGFIYSHARQFDKAEEQLRLIIELDRTDASAHNSLGYELADRGRNLDEAERLIRRALELDRARKSDSLEDEGESADYLDSLGWVLFRRGRFAEAKELIERSAAMPAAANVPEVWDHLGDVCARMDRPAEAVAAWQKALELSRTEKVTINDPRGAEVKRKLKRLHAVSEAPQKR
jgi:tetratricopeptide (TPR) repeat protein